MHIAEITEPLTLGPLGTFPPGEYLTEDLNGAEFMMVNKRGATRLTHIKESPAPLDPSRDYNHSRILLVRPGGFGDLLFLTPSIRELKRRHPLCQVYVCCFDRFSEILRHNPMVDGVISYPIPWKEALSFDVMVFLENVIEGNPEAETTHAIDIVAKRVGLPSLEDKEMVYNLTGAEKAWADGAYPRTKYPRLGVQVKASSKCRSYPGAELSKVLTKLRARGWEIFLLGAPNDVPTNTGSVFINLTQAGLSFRQSVAAMSTCDVVLGPDSALIHVAGALHMPAIGLYGPFPWQLRTKYAPTVEAIQGPDSVCSKAPCQFHSSGHVQFPKGGPCASSGRCEVLAAITPERIVSKIEQAYER